MDENTFVTNQTSNRFYYLHHYQNKLSTNHSDYMFHNFLLK